MRWIYLILFLGVFLVGAPMVIQLIERGKKVSNSTLTDGIVQESPVDLAGESGETVDVYSLARAISSEQETKSPNAAELVGVGWVIRREAESRGISITSLLTSDDGYYGEQGKASGYASTARDPYERDLTIARGIIGGSIPDNTKGARHFFAPKTQDILHERNPAKWKSADEIDSGWKKDGFSPVIVDGIDDSKLRFYRKA